MEPRIMDASASSASLRIGLFTPAWPGTNTPNGVATVVTHLTAGLESLGHEVTIITFGVDAESDFLRVIPVPQQSWSLSDRLRMRFGSDTEAVAQRRVARRIAAAAHEAIRHHGIEVLIIEETQGWASTLRDMISIPIVVTLHGPWWLHKDFQAAKDALESDRREKREAVGLRSAAAITAPSADVLERTAENWGLPPVPLAVIHNPMPIHNAPTEFDPARLQNILFVGRFERVKGGDVVIEAFAELARQHPTCRLTFAGPDLSVERPGREPLSLDEALSRLPENARSRIDVKGQISREEVSALRQTHGIAIIASRYESFGGTIAEAMAAASAIVSTNVGGAGEILSDEETGLLVPSEDPQAMAQACLRLLNDPDLARQLGVAARAYVENNLSPQVIGQQVADFLRPICRG